MPGPGPMYCTKYLTKSNQRDDEYNYRTTAEYMRRRLSEKRKETEFGEGLSRIISASFVHNSKNVIGPALARYLTLFKTRFRFSHDFCYVPIEDILRILEKNGVAVAIQTHVKRTYLENSAYHYLFTLLELKNLDPHLLRVFFVCISGVINVKPKYPFFL